MEPIEYSFIVLFLFTMIKNDAIIATRREAYMESHYYKKVKADGSIDDVYNNPIYQLTINRNKIPNYANVNMQFKVDDDKQVINQLVRDLTEMDSKMNSLLNCIDSLVQEGALPLAILEYVEENLGFVSDEAASKDSISYVKKISIKE